MLATILLSIVLLFFIYCLVESVRNDRRMRRNCEDVMEDRGT